MARRKGLALLMAMMMLFCYGPVVSFADVDTLLIAPAPLTAQSFTDMPSDWSTAALQAAVDNGLIKGYDGASGTEIRPSGTLTRAEMATVVNRAFGATKTATLNGVGDVQADQWYANEMAKAVQMGTMKADTNMRPNDKITRQEAFTILARAFNLTAGGSNAAAKFGDAGQISSWALDSMNALVEGGYVSGSGNNLNPTANITRAEFAQIMSNVAKGYVRSAGTVTEVPGGNVIINTNGVTLKGVTVTGDLIIADGVDAGTITLEGVTVKGRVLVRSGNLKADDKTKLNKIQVLSDNTSIEAKSGVVEAAAGVTGLKVNGEAVAAGASYTIGAAVSAGGGGGGNAPSPSYSDYEIVAAGVYNGGTYKDVTITDAVADGTVEINGMNIRGKLIVQGGGSSSIKVSGSTVSEVVMDKTGGQNPRLELTNTPVAKIVAEKPAIIEAMDTTSRVTNLEAKNDVTLQGAATEVANLTVPADAKANTAIAVNSGAEVAKVETKQAATLSADNAASTIGEVKAGKNFTVNGSNTNIEKITVPENAEAPTIAVNGGNVKEVVAESAATIGGSAENAIGNVEAKAPVNVDSVAVQTVTVVVNVTVTVSGTAGIEVAVNVTGNTDIITTNTNVTVSTNQESGVTITTKDSAEAEGTTITHICKWEETSRTAATCTQTGIVNYTCKCTDGTCPNSGTKSETLPKVSHIVVNDEGHAATCTGDGNKPGTHCSVCGEVLVAPTAITALGHAKAVHEMVESTCTQTGINAYWSCDRCGKNYRDEVCTEEIANLSELIIPLALHTTNHHEANEAFCEEAGNIEYWECSACGKCFSDELCETEIKEADTVIKALGHTPVNYDFTPATESSQAIRAGVICDACDKIISGRDGIPYHEITDLSLATDGAVTITTPNTENFEFVEIRIFAAGSDEAIFTTRRGPHSSEESIYTVPNFNLVYDLASIIVETTVINKIEVGAYEAVDGKGRQTGVKSISTNFTLEVSGEAILYEMHYTGDDEEGDPWYDVCLLEGGFSTDSNVEYENIVLLKDNGGLDKWVETFSDNTYKFSRWLYSGDEEGATSLLRMITFDSEGNKATLTPIGTPTPLPERTTPWEEDFSGLNTTDLAVHIDSIDGANVSFSEPENAKSIEGYQFELRMFDENGYFNTYLEFEDETSNFNPNMEIDPDWNRTMEFNKLVVLTQDENGRNIAVTSCAFNYTFEVKDITPVITNVEKYSTGVAISYSGITADQIKGFIIDASYHKTESSEWASHFGGTWLGDQEFTEDGSLIWSWETEGFDEMIEKALVAGEEWFIRFATDLSEPMHPKFTKNSEIYTVPEVEP